MKHKLKRETYTSTRTSSNKQKRKHVWFRLSVGVLCGGCQGRCRNPPPCFLVPTLPPQLWGGQEATRAVEGGAGHFLVPRAGSPSGCGHGPAHLLPTQRRAPCSSQFLAGKWAVGTELGVSIRGNLCLLTPTTRVGGGSSPGGSSLFFLALACCKVIMETARVPRGLGSVQPRSSPG